MNHFWHKENAHHRVSRHRPNDGQNQSLQIFMNKEKLGKEFGRRNFSSPVIFTFKLSSNKMFSGWNTREKFINNFSQQLQIWARSYFKITMNDISWMNIVNALEYLTHNIAGLFLRECHHRREIVKELAVTTQFKHEENKGVWLENIL